MIKWILKSSLAIFFFLPVTVYAQIHAVWLNFKRHEPTHIVVNWATDTLSNSWICWGNTPAYGHMLKIEERTTLHHIEIPLDGMVGEWVYYKVGSGLQESGSLKFRNYPQRKDSLRIAVVANVGYMRGTLMNIEKEAPDILMTCGDNIPNLHLTCGLGDSLCVLPYLDLIGRYPQLFSETPFMPILGNHDKEIRKRGTEPPAIAVYDTNATAYCHFFDLPDQEWAWQMQFPEFGVDFLALDLNHTYDVGTTWQSCHDFSASSYQLAWYRRKVNRSVNPFLITLMNEKNETVRIMQGGIWKNSLDKNTVIITGCCYMSERAETDGVYYLNTSTIAGDIYPDPFSKSLYREPAYLILLFRKDKPLQVEIKKLDGILLERFEVSASRFIEH